MGQEDPASTPGADVPSDQDAEAQTTEPAATETTAPAGDTAPSASANLAAAPQGPPALAQGLIYLDGGDVWWQVREVELPPPAEASSVAGSSRFILQRSGVSIIRNDITGKRTRLEQDEVYYAAAGDPYTTMAADDSRSVVWIFEVANSDQVGEGAFYLSPNIGGIAEGTYDLEFTHELLEAGGSTGFVSEGGPFLIMVLTGQVVVSDGEGTATLVSGEGRIVEGNNATIEAEGDGQATYVAVAIGASVSDASVAAPAASAAPAEPAESDVPGVSVGDLGTSGATDTAAQEPVSEERAPVEERAEPASQSQESGDYVTSIAVTAASPVTISVIVDGVSVFDGYLEAGESTSYFTGSVFEVYTTSGVNTIFTNTCSNEPFVMGYEEGDAYYVLEATDTSCAPAE